MKKFKELISILKTRFKKLMFYDTPLFLANFYYGVFMSFKVDNYIKVVLQGHDYGEKLKEEFKPDWLLEFLLLALILRNTIFKNFLETEILINIIHEEKESEMKNWGFFKRMWRGIGSKDKLELKTKKPDGTEETTKSSPIQNLPFLIVSNRYTYFSLAFLIYLFADETNKNLILGVFGILGIPVILFSIGLQFKIIENLKEKHLNISTIFSNITSILWLYCKSTYYSFLFILYSVGAWAPFYFFWYKRVFREEYYLFGKTDDFVNLIILAISLLFFYGFYKEAEIVQIKEIKETWKTWKNLKFEEDKK